MNTNQSIQVISYLAAMILLSVIVSDKVSSEQVSASEPYSHHFDPYSYGYETEDNYGSKQWKQERSNHPDEVHGSYGYRDNHGIYREVTYVADQNGFRANIKTNEPGVTGSSDKSPASTKIESHYTPHSSHASPPVSYQPMAQQYQHVTTSQQQQTPAASPPVYIRQHYVAAPAYYQATV